MAMTELGLLFIGALATLATLGIFVDFRDSDGQPDRATSVLVAFVGALLWGIFALSSSDVIVRSSSVATSSEPIEPLFWVGVLMGMLVGVYALYMLIRAFSAETSDVSPELIQ